MRINARLAPEVYLGVVPIVRLVDGRHLVDSEAHGLDASASGEVVEWAVKMLRLPDDRTLDWLLAVRAEPVDVVELLARTLIGFHEAAASRWTAPAHRARSYSRSRRRCPSRLNSGARSLGCEVARLRNAVEWYGHLTVNVMPSFCRWASRPLVAPSTPRRRAGPGV